MGDRELSYNREAVSLTRVDDQYSKIGYADYELVSAAPSVDLGVIWSAIVRNRWLILGIFGLAIAAGVASIYLASPVYRAEASIQIEPQTLRILGAENVASDVPRSEADRYLQTQVDILTSRATAQMVAANLNLKSNPAFLRDVGLHAPSHDRNIERRLASALMERLTVSWPPDSRIISLSYDSHDPEIASAVVNKFAETFIADSLQRRLDTFSFSKTLLQQQLEQTKQRLERSERALIAYARSAGLVGGAAAVATPTDTDRRSLTAAVLDDLNSSYSQKRAERVQAEQRWQQTLATPLMDLPEVLSNPSIQALTERRAELQAAFQEQSQRRKADHPSMRQAAALLREMDRQIATLASGIRNSIADQYRVARRQEDALRTNITELKSAVFDEQSKGVAYNILKREADTNRNLYNSLLQRYHEVRTQAADTNSTISIIDRAQPPMSPRYPQPLFNMTVASLVGVLLALSAAYVRGKLDRRVHGPLDVERDFGLPLLGVVPLLKGPQNFERALVDPMSEVSEAHHSVCLALSSVAQSSTRAVLLLTSTSPHEGKSTTAFKLGVNFAAANKRVLLIDGDMRRGSLHRLLGMTNEVGLSDLLETGSEQSTLDAIKFCARYGFAFLPRGRSRCNPAELLASNRFPELLDEVRPYYDIVAIDGPPVLGLADAPRFAGLADATVFVMEADRTSKPDARIALKRLAEAQADQVGIILTKYDPSRDHGVNRYAYNYAYSDGQELGPELTT